MLDVNILFVVIIVYISLYSLIIFFKPSIIYDRYKGSLRQFGVGYKNTTILPLWLVSILLAIISYFIVLYVIHLRYNTIFIKINPLN
jgi:hypothetical protein|uniref:Uncharacterized protein n=1 Tax=viral metagenome TaxID=1070528 RepID=A0A6C0ES28_9ZZZZ